MILHKIKSRDGFFSVIALGIFAVMMIYGIILAKTNLKTIESVKNSNNYYAARDTADSVMEYLQYELNSREAGFNLSGSCNEDGTPKDDTNSDAMMLSSEICAQFYDDLKLTDKNVKITAEIKGRSSAAATEYFEGCPGMDADQCYVVPFPGTGDASRKCTLYRPQFGPDSEDRMIDNNGQTAESVCTEGDDCISQLDYSCNWNRLAFGSSVTDRVAIPLYYEDENGNIISPFNSDPDLNGGAQATEFVLRLRTPCEPNDKYDETICDDSDRYDLDDTPKDDIVVQWQITGTCEENGKDVACGLIQNVTGSNKSAIYESVINNTLFKNKALNGEDFAIETSSYSQIGIKAIIEKIKLYKKPTLTLFLSEKLTSWDRKSVLYLECQLLVDQPVANPKIKMEATATVDGNTVTKTLYKEEQKDLIDFAVQN